MNIFLMLYSFEMEMNVIRYDSDTLSFYRDIYGLI